MQVLLFLCQGSVAHLWRMYYVMNLHWCWSWGRRCHKSVAKKYALWWEVQRQTTYWISGNSLGIQPEAAQHWLVLVSSSCAALTQPALPCTTIMYMYTVLPECNVKTKQWRKTIGRRALHMLVTGDDETIHFRHNEGQQPIYCISAAERASIGTYLRLGHTRHKARYHKQYVQSIHRSAIVNATMFHDSRKHPCMAVCTACRLQLAESAKYLHSGHTYTHATCHTRKDTNRDWILCVMTQ